MDTANLRFRTPVVTVLPLSSPIISGNTRQHTYNYGVRSTVPFDTERPPRLPNPWSKPRAGSTKESFPTSKDGGLGSMEKAIGG